MVSIAFVPRSVLATIRAADGVTAHRLPAQAARVITALIWRKSEHSPMLGALRAEMAALTSAEGLEK